MSAKKWFNAILIMTILTLFLIGGVVFFVDPFFHYRAPNPLFFYKLYDQRSQNDGITKHFDYDAIITGTSMSENFKASQFEEGLGFSTIKVTYSGATYKEINDNLAVAYRSGHNPRYVLRPLDYSLLVKDKDELREDMGEYPEWITNDNPIDDVKYLLNKDVLLRYALPALASYFQGEEPGHTSFDDYSYTDQDNKYGKDYVLMGKKRFKEPESQLLITGQEEEFKILDANIEQNVVSLARKHPETKFLYFFPPYSMVYWGNLYEAGELDEILAYKEAAIRQMLECDNIHIYSFTTHTDITTDLSKYRDQAHYDAEVNSFIMDTIIKYENGYEETDMFTSSDRITGENVDDYLMTEKVLLNSFDYNSLIK
ncbi:hypothetical protein [Butyrivibrio sp. LC3010]|uniref:hypothetical protein n=1 Tax=Butyrivibrio sp. LC3010 TaxID=1280680 RepID=UPI000414D288|nr:hypothetical protein [Butyrivibrio sp. LC3010]